MTTEDKDLTIDGKPIEAAKPAAPATKAQPAKISNDEADALVDDVLDGLGWQPKKKAEDKPAAKDEKDAEPADDAADEAAAAKAAEAEKQKQAERKTKLTKRPPPLDAKSLAKEVAAETGKAVAEALRPKEEKPAEVELDETDQRDLEVLKSLESMNEKYKGIHKKTKDFFEKVLAPYKAKWLRAHPGDVFEPNADEHSAIYDKQPQIDPDDFEKANKEWIDEQKLKKIESKIESKLQDKIKEVERKDMERDLAPRVAESGQNEVAAMVKEIAPEFEELLGKENGVKEMQEKDPIAFDILDKAARTARAAAAEFERLMVPELGHKFEPKTNELHADIAAHINRYEGKIQELPDKDKVWNGKQFATLQEWHGMSPAERAEHWIVSWKDIRDDYFPDLRQNVKEFIKSEKERVVKAAERMGYKRTGAGENTPGQQQQSAAAAAAAKPKPKPPASSSSNDAVTTQKPSQAASGSFEDQIVQDLFGR